MNSMIQPSFGRARSSSLRLLVALVVVMLTPLLLGGCSCSERVHVANGTNEMLHVQVQLPKPEVPWACGCKCVYETLVGPGGIWTSARPGSADQMDHPPEAYSDCAVVRARIGVSGDWAKFTICGEDVDRSSGDPVIVTVSAGTHAGLDATAVTKSGKALGVTAAVTDH